MTTRDDQPLGKHRSSPSVPQQSSFNSSHSSQPVLSHVPRFALVHDLATGAKTHAPVTYLFSDEPHPPLSTNDGRTRTLLVDLSPDGDKVVQAESMTGEWQLVSANLGTSARIANPEGGESSPGNAVLNIEGLGQFTPIVRNDDVFDMARQFTER